MLNGDKKAAVIAAGYTENLDRAASMACQLLKNPKILSKISELKLRNAVKRGIVETKEFSKDDFISYALRDYESVAVEEPNRARMLELAGKGAGIIGGSNDSRPNQTLQLTQINIIGNETPQELWQLTRKLLGNE